MDRRAIAPVAFLLAACAKAHPTEAECRKMDDHLAAIAIADGLAGDAGLAPEERDAIEKQLRDDRANDPQTEATLRYCVTTLTRDAYACVMAARAPAEVDACEKR